MSSYSNDLVMIDGIIDSLCSSNDTTIIGHTFEEFSVEQYLKKYVITQEDLKKSEMDGRKDGGVDYAFLFINGFLITEIEKLPNFRDKIQLDLYIITSKHADTFVIDPIESLISTMGEYLDLSKKSEKLKYNTKMIKFRELFCSVYKKTAIYTNDLKIHYCYLSRGSTESIGEEVEDRRDNLLYLTKDKFSDTEVTFDFIGATELLKKYRESKERFVDLKFLKNLSNNGQYILLVNILDFYNFLLDSDGDLNRSLFDSNVRSYMGLNRVNSDILASLNDDINIDFWYLNNGITIIVPPKPVITENTITLNNPQIINGLQTSESIFSYFNTHNEKKDERNILIKILVTSDNEVQKKIIKATNNQTPVDVVSLYATEEYQKSINEYLLKNGIHYDLVHNYYRNKGFSDVVTMQYLASGYIALIQKQPIISSCLKQKKIPKIYNQVFNDKIDIRIWPNIVRINLATDKFLMQKRCRGNSEGLLRKWRPIFSYLGVAITLSTFTFGIDNIVNISVDENNFANSYFEEMWNYLESNGIELTSNNKKKIYKPVFEMYQVFGKKYNLNNTGYLSVLKNDSSRNTSILSDDFILEVYNLLPAQPWPMGIHRNIAKKLHSNNTSVWDAIEILIEEGKVYNQKDGVLFDLDGNVVTGV